MERWGSLVPALDTVPTPLSARRADRHLAARTSRTAAPPQPGHVEWQLHWVVRMHKDNQWYPSLGQHRVRFRGPYLKGPVDKSLFGGEIRRGLVR